MSNKEKTKKIINLFILTVLSLTVILILYNINLPKMVNISTDTISPTIVYEVDAWGSDPDIIEFTPINHKNMTCLILVSGDDNAAGITCFPKNITNN